MLGKGTEIGINRLIIIYCKAFLEDGKKARWLSDLGLDGYKDIREAKTHGVGAELLFTVFIIQVSRYLQLQNVQHSRT